MGKAGKARRSWDAFILVNPANQYIGELYGSRDDAECALCGDETVVEVRLTEITPKPRRKR